MSCPIHYHTLCRKCGVNLAVYGLPRCLSWEEVKRKFSIGNARALECEDQLRQGVTVLIADAQEWEGDWAVVTTIATRTLVHKKDFRL